MLKIFVSYLNEGIKIYFRSSYGILYLLKVNIYNNSFTLKKYISKKEILKEDAKDSISEVIRAKAQKFDLIQAHKLLKIVYALSLTNMKSTFANMSFAKMSMKLSFHASDSSFIVCIRFHHI